MELRLEVVQVPVADVDRAKAFYTDQAGFAADHDTTISDAVRFVQLTPPGSGCSIVIGAGLSAMAPGSVDGLQLVVADIAAVREELTGRGVDVSEIEELAAPGKPAFKFAYFSDPDGNGWVLQEIPPRRAAPTSVDGVDFITLPTRDFERASEFYGTVLGLPRSAQWGSMPAAEYETGTLTIAVMQSDAFGVEFEAHSHPVALHVGDVAAARERLEAQGVAFRGETIDSGVCHMAHFADPDGNALMLHHRYAPRR